MSFQAFSESILFCLPKNVNVQKWGWASWLVLTQTWVVLHFSSWEMCKTHFFLFGSIPFSKYLRFLMKTRDIFTETFLDSCNFLQSRVSLLTNLYSLFCLSALPNLGEECSLSYLASQGRVFANILDDQLSFPVQNQELLWLGLSVCIIHAAISWA